MLDPIVNKAAEMYWLNRLSGALPGIGLPRVKREEATTDGARIDFQIDVPPPVSGRLQEISGHSDMALFILFLTGLYVALYRYTGIEDILVGTISPRREGSKGNLLFCRSRLNGGATLKEMINQIKEGVIEDFDYVDYSFGILYQKLLANKDVASLDIFNVAFIYDKLQERSRTLNQFGLVLVLTATEGGLALKAEYNPSLYGAETVEHFCRNLLFLFEDILAKLDTRVDCLDIRGPEEKKLFDAFNDTVMPFPVERTISALLNDQVEKNPDRVAVVFENAHITYRRLHEGADRLSRYLRDQGVKPGSIVGIMLDRSLQVVMAMLAVLKAGGAYLPIDPRMPKNRIETMLRDTGARILLTENAVARKHPFTVLQGLNDRDLAFHLSPPRPQIVDLDRLPIPDRSMVDLEKYNRYIGQVMVKDIISLQTARGCPYNCSYCSKIWHKKHVHRSAENVFQEMKLYYDMGVRRFSIFDDIFNIDLKNSARFFELIIKNGLKVQLFFPNGLRGDLLTKDYIDLLVEAGLVCTALALETASERLQKLINKNLKLDIFRENAEYFCQKYPQVVLELFTMHGFPTETEAEARLTLDFIKSLKWIHFPYVFILKVYPGTEMADLAMREGVRWNDILLSEDMAFHELSPTSPFKRSFTKNYQAEFLNDYFLSKERLLHVLPYQARVFTEDEIIQKYDSYLPTDIKTLSDLLKLADIKEDELKIDRFMPDDHFQVPDLNEKIREHFPVHRPAKDALRVLFLDLSQFFSGEADMLYDVVEPPLGGIYVMTYLKSQLGEKVDGKILKSRIDFDSFAELKRQIEAFKPQVIGVRSLTFYRDFFHRTIAAIRQWGIAVPIIAGGPYATRNYQSLLRDKNIDLLAISEGETVFCEIIEKIIENGGKLPDEATLSTITGIAFVPRQKMGDEFARVVVLIDESTELFAKERTAKPPAVHNDSDPAYIIFTSGSTGKPKGVVVENRQVANVLHWFGWRYGLKEDTHVLQLSNYTFDPSVEQVFATLLFGATLYIPRDRDIVADREAFITFVERHQIELINFVPGTLKELLGFGAKCPTLKKVISGGEKLDGEVKNLLLNKGYELHNHYGPTETTVDALADRCSGAAVTLGRPIANARCYIMSGNGAMAPIGVTGELCIAGAGVARGYLNNPELTAEKFGRGENRLYKTGDLGRWLPEGKVEFLGRIDKQVKIRGFRIEPGEIESHLLKYRSIRDAVVVAFTEAETGGQFLCAYFVSSEDLEAAELREYLSAMLPDYMVPAYFVQIDKIPLNANGKVDRLSLPQPKADSSRVVYEAPRNDIEENLTSIWSEVLGAKSEDIGIDSNFFEIGGDSIKVIQIAARLRKYGLKMESGDLFLNPTIRQLGPHVKRLERQIDQGPVQGEIPLTPVQHWFFAENMEAKHHYNMAVMLFSAECFDVEVLKQVFTKIQEHHDALRLIFKEENGRSIQVNAGLDHPFSLQVFDFSGLDHERAVQELRSKANGIQGSIDLAHGPLMKLALFRLADGDRLLIVAHHLVIDGISFRILFEDIQTLYQQYREGQPPVLPLKTDSFHAWSRAVGEYADTPGFLEKEKPYWAKVEGTSVPVIPTDFTAPNLRADNQRVSIDLSEEDTQLLLSDVHTAFSTEINDILLTALALAVREIFANDRLAVSLEGHGREPIGKDIDISRTVGWFTSVYPVVLDLSANVPTAGNAPADLDRAIVAIKEILHRLPNRGIGYGIFKYLTRPEHKKDIVFRLKPQVGFNYLGQFDADVGQMSFGIARESTGRIHSEKGHNEFELDVSGMIAAKRMVMAVSFSKKQFKEETVRALLQSYKKHLVHIIDFCSKKQERELTPSDLDYKDLSVEDLDAIFD